MEKKKVCSFSVFFSVFFCSFLILFQKLLQRAQRKSVGRGIIHQIAIKLDDSADNMNEKSKSKNEVAICFLDASCALQKETAPWEGAPIYQKPIKTKLTNKIDDEKVCWNNSFAIHSDFLTLIYF